MSDLDRAPVSRGLLYGLGAVALLALLWLLVLGPMLTGGGDEDFELPPKVARTPDAPLPGEEVPEDDGTGLYPETTEVFAARDPFAQLVSDAADGAGGGGNGPLPGDGASPGGGDPDDAGGGSGETPSGEDPSRPRNGNSAQVGGTRVKLVDVYDQDGQPRALVTVNGRSYDVAEGEAFGDRFRLLDLSGECGTFLFGDSRFVLCEGDEIRK